MNVQIKAAGESNRYAERDRHDVQKLRSMGAIAAVLAADLHDPAAVEGLLILRELCYIWELADSELELVFGRRVLQVLDEFGDIVPPKQRPAQLRRAWVWQSHRARPQLCAIDRDGAIWLGA